MTTRSDDGFSLVEVIIAMFLLAVVSLAVLPLIISGVRLSSLNKDLVAATAFANTRIAVLRDDFPLNPTTPTSCAALQTRAVGIASALADPAATGMKATIAILDSCPAATADFPASIRLTVTVRDSAGDTLVTVPTRFRVSNS